MAFDDSLTLDFSIGAAHIGVVNDATHRMTVTDDGKKYGTFPVSLGANNTPTAHGTKVIMEKGRSICMSGPGYNECGIKDTQRLTYGGEYLHSAPWNVGNIGNGIDSSNGCTNLLPADAAKLYPSCAWATSSTTRTPTVRRCPRCRLRRLERQLGHVADRRSGQHHLLTRSIRSPRSWTVAARAFVVFAGPIPTAARWRGGRPTPERIDPWSS